MFQSLQCPVGGAMTMTEYCRRLQSQTLIKVWGKSDHAHSKHNFLFHGKTLKKNVFNENTIFKPLSIADVSGLFNQC